MEASTRPVVALVAAAAMAMAGCFGGGSDFDPNRDFEETGRLIHLKMTVVDLFQHEVAPELEANMWAFCVEPVNPNDVVSAAAIEYFTPVAGDAPNLDDSQRKTCSVPGPTIRVRQGDTVRVEFTHSHFHPHTIHWHGQFVPWESDGAPGATQSSIASGESFTYEFVAKRAGTLWYHCHVDTQHHVMQGLYGAFIVEPQDDKLEPKDIDKEFVWVLSTLNKEVVRALPGVNPHSQHGAGCASGFKGCENPPSDVTPDTWLINGHSFPLTMESPETLIRVSEGDRIRIRFVNVGETMETMHPHGHDMLVTHRDGNPLPTSARFWVDTLTIGPGERYDVVMEMDNPGPWMFHTHVNSHETNCGKSGGGMHSMILYEGFDHHMFEAELPASCPFSEPFSLQPDHQSIHRLSLGSGTDASASFTFPIAQECSFRAATVSVDLSVDDPVFATLNELRVTVADPAGTEIASGVLGGPQGAARYNVTFTATDVVGHFDPSPTASMVGDWTVTLQGRAVGASALGVASVDYLEHLEQSRLHHPRTGLPACPGITT